MIEYDVTHRYLLGIRAEEPEKLRVVHRATAQRNLFEEDTIFSDYVTVTLIVVEEVPEHLSPLNSYIQGVLAVPVVHHAALRVSYSN